MSGKNAVVGGVVSLVAVGLGLGWNALRQRRAAKGVFDKQTIESLRTKVSAETVEVDTPERINMNTNVSASVDDVTVSNDYDERCVRTSSGEQVTVVVSETAQTEAVYTGSAAVLHAKHMSVNAPSPVDSAWFDSMVKVHLADLPTPTDFVTEEVDDFLVTYKLDGADGTKLLAVSRMRDATVTQPTTPPMFWDAFVRNIRRPDVLELTQSDFDKGPHSFARGYHNCRLDGINHGVLHVTKGHITMVYHKGGDDFAGISTSGSRFGGHGVRDVTEKQAHDFLNGR